MPRGPNGSRRETRYASSHREQSPRAPGNPGHPGRSLTDTIRHPAIVQRPPATRPVRALDAARRCDRGRRQAASRACARRAASKAGVIIAAPADDPPVLPSRDHARATCGSSHRPLGPRVPGSRATIALHGSARRARSRSVGLTVGPQPRRTSRASVCIRTGSSPSPRIQCLQSPLAGPMTGTMAHPNRVQSASYPPLPGGLHARRNPAIATATPRSRALLARSPLRGHPRRRASRGLASPALLGDPWATADQRDFARFLGLTVHDHHPCHRGHSCISPAPFSPP